MNMVKICQYSASFIQLKQIIFNVNYIFVCLFLCIYNTFSLLALLQNSYLFHLCMTDEYASHLVYCKKNPDEWKYAVQTHKS